MQVVTWKDFRCNTNMHYSEVPFQKRRILVRKVWIALNWIHAKKAYYHVISCIDCEGVTTTVYLHGVFSLNRRWLHFKVCLCDFYRLQTDLNIFEIMFATHVVEKRRRQSQWNSISWASFTYLHLSVLQICTVTAYYRDHFRKPIVKSIIRIMLKPWKKWSSYGGGLK